ncbi:hypothetical protein KY345_00990, partial [Candidatus Woesearchaeota archaeon]|nr:hypothetical protein [Candidatus Woesearchaeota archaeon]
MKYKNFLRDMEFTYGVKLGVGDLSSLYSYSNLSSTAFRRLNTYDKIALIVDFLERFDYSKRAAKASKDIIADA